LTLAVQADEFRSIRARAIAAGGTPSIPEAPRNVLSNLLRGRIEDVSGWALLNQDKADQAVEPLKRAISILPEGTPAARAALWHLGVALERQDKKAEALAYYIKSYNSGEPDPVRRSVVEQLYRKVNGSLDGLDERIGPPLTSAQPSAASGSENAPAPTPSPATTTPISEATPAPSEPAPSPETPAAKPEATPASEPLPSTSPTPSPSPSESATGHAALAPAATPSPESPAPATATPSPAAESSLASSPVETINKPPRTTVAITGRVKDANGNGVANVVVVLISPQGTVLASTTDEQGNYSFTVARSEATRSYRIIPSKDGFAFEPVDRVLPLAGDDVKELDFVERPAPKP
jgi:outer membrane biosynthesis protein TonB